uniref:Protein transport protein sec16 n=1 Tax=Meloidogyne floridensis TaxID=298350 RepID=A0A915PB92_9BILA
MQKHSKIPKMASSSRRSDYGEEFIEQLRRDRFKKSYILVNGVNSSEEEDEELDFDEEDDEMASYAMGGPLQQQQQFQQPPRPSSTHSSRRPPSVAASLSQRTGGAFGFDAKDLYFFGVLTEITDKFTPDRAARFIAKSSPPYEFRTLSSIERVAYLFYYSLYERYLNVPKEFFKYTSAGDSERGAFLKICRHTLQEYKRRMLERNKLAYKLAQKHLFSDERATSGSRASDRPSFADGDSENSLQSLANELMFYRAPHAPIHFAAKGRLVFVNPEIGISIVCIENTKKFYKDSEGRRFVETFENFKGPLLIDYTPPQTPLLFIQRQIERIYSSDVYRANPKSGDANDCVLIWALLEMLKVTGPDLARLLCSSDRYTPFSNQSFLRTESQTSIKSSVSVDPQAMERITRYLLGGHIEEAIESAIGDGLFFDALMLAHRLFRHDRLRQETIEAKLMAYRSPNHPITTLINVASDSPVPLLVLYQLGLSLAQKEFNAAADFCFLSVNLLTGYNCFQPPNDSELDDHPKYRKHISLLNASIPDDSLNSCITRFGWSVFDYQATEIYEYALRLGNGNAITALSQSDDFVQTKRQYVQLLGELGGFDHSIELYNSNEGKEQPGREHPHNPNKAWAPPKLPHLSSQSIGETFVASETISSSPPNYFPEIKKEEKKKKEKQQQKQIITASSPTQVKAFVHRPQESFVNNEELCTGIASFPSQDFVGGGIPPEFPPIPPYQHQQQQPLTEEPPILKVVNSLPPNSERSNRSNSEDSGGAGESFEENVRRPSGGDSSFLPQHEFPLPPFNNNRRRNSSTSSNVLPPQPTKILQQHPPLPQKTKNEKNLRGGIGENENIGNSTTGGSSGGGGGGGFLSGKIGGLFSKITQLQGHNTMKLPDDKNPEIVWDPQQNKYVDKSGQAIEEIAPPPPPIISTSTTNLQQERTTPTSSTPIFDDEQQQQQQMFSFSSLFQHPQQFPPMPNIEPIQQQQSNVAATTSSKPTSTATSSRPFQGRNRYANAWNS